MKLDVDTLDMLRRLQEGIDAAVAGTMYVGNVHVEGDNYGDEPPDYISISLRKRKK